MAHSAETTYNGTVNGTAAYIKGRMDVKFSTSGTTDTIYVRMAIFRNNVYSSTTSSEYNNDSIRASNSYNDDNVQMWNGSTSGRFTVPATSSASSVPTTSNAKWVPSSSGWTKLTEIDHTNAVTVTVSCAFWFGITSLGSGTSTFDLQLPSHSGPEPPTPTGDNHYACFDVNSWSFISGYEDIATDDYYVEEPIGSNYIGYVSYDSFENCIDYFDRHGYDSDSETGAFADGNYLVFFYSGAPSGKYHYACYDEDNRTYITGYTDKTSPSKAITRPELQGYTYNGYVYWDSFARCIKHRITDGGNYDGTGITCDKLSDDLNYVVFFYSKGSSSIVEIPMNIAPGEILSVCIHVATRSTYKFYTEGSNDTYGYLTAGTSYKVTDRVPEGIIAKDDDSHGNLNYEINITLDPGDYRIWTRFYSASAGGDTTFYIDPRITVFYGEVYPSGKTTAHISATMAFGDASYASRRYIRVKAGTTISNMTWRTNYIPANELGGSNNTFEGDITGLSSATHYIYEIHLFSASYVDVGAYIRGEFTTNESATGLMIYVDGWKNCIPYVFNNGSWHKTLSRLYNGGWIKP